MTLDEKSINKILVNLETANKELTKIYPGDLPDRQPVQTVYGGAHLFKFNTAVKMGEFALKSFLENAADVNEFAKALELNPKEPSLKSNKVKTPKNNLSFSSRIKGDIRLIWNYSKNEVYVLDLLDTGGHSGKDQFY